MKPAGFNPKAYIPSYGMAEATLAISFAPHGQGFSTDSIDPKSLQASETKPSTAEDAQEARELRQGDFRITEDRDRRRKRQSSRRAQGPDRS